MRLLLVLLMVLLLLVLLLVIMMLVLLQRLLLLHRRCRVLTVGGADDGVEHFTGKVQHGDVCGPDPDRFLLVAGLSLVRPIFISSHTTTTPH